MGRGRIQLQDIVARGAAPPTGWAASTPSYWPDFRACLPSCDAADFIALSLVPRLIL
jgi:hypothetical protein